MNLRHLSTLLLTLLLAVSAHAESFSGSIAFGTTSDLQGELHYTALSPGETTSSFGVFSGYSQAASSDYTYLYFLQNDSLAGTPTSFCNEHCFYGLDLETLLDPTGPDIHSVGFDSSNGGETPSFFGENAAPDLVFFEFDNAPNYGILPDGGFSAVLRFFSPLAPGSGGGAYITNNTAGPNDFFHITSGVTTPVPEPTSAALLALGLVGIAARRRAR